MKRGFTLVELSIVLVIIGLLIGGVLVAQSMISTARIQSYVKKLQQYEIAVTNFENNYKSTPGDSNYFEPVGCNVGYNFGIVRSDCGIVDVTYSDTEFFHTFAHLSQAGMIEGNYRGLLVSDPQAFNIAAGTAGITHPVFAEDKRWQGIVVGNSTSKIPAEYIKPQTGGRYYLSYLSIYDSIALDSKMDDGRTGYGSFKAWEYYGTDCQGYPAAHENDPGNYPYTEEQTICSFQWYPDKNAP